MALQAAETRSAEGSAEEPTRSLGPLSRRLVRNVAPIKMSAAGALEEVCVPRLVQLSDPTCG